MAEMARRGGPIAIRLKAYVREYVRADRSRGAALAKAINRPQSWLTEYVDEKPTQPRWADIDTAAALCEGMGFTLAEFLTTDPPQPLVLSPAQAEGLEVAELWPNLDPVIRRALKTMMTHAGRHNLPDQPSEPPSPQSSPEPPPGATGTGPSPPRDEDQ